MHHLEEIPSLPLLWVISQLIYLLHYYQAYPNFLDHKYKIMNELDSQDHLHCFHLEIDIFFFFFRNPNMWPLFLHSNNHCQFIIWTIDALGLFLKNLSKAPFYVSMKLSVCFFLFLFSLPDGYFLDDRISQLTITKSEIKNNKHITKFLRTKRKKDKSLRGIKSQI
jgi:hypothetical protein